MPRSVIRGFLSLSCAKPRSWRTALAGSAPFANFSASKGQRDFDGQPNDAKKRKRIGKPWKTTRRKDSQPVPDWKWQSHGPQNRVIPISTPSAKKDASHHQLICPMVEYLKLWKLKLVPSRHGLMACQLGCCGRLTERSGKSLTIWKKSQKQGNAFRGTVVRSFRREC